MWSLIYYILHIYKYFIITTVLKNQICVLQFQFCGEFVNHFDSHNVLLTRTLTLEPHTACSTYTIHYTPTHLPTYITTHLRLNLPIPIPKL